MSQLLADARQIAVAPATPGFIPRKVTLWTRLAQHRSLYLLLAPGIVYFLVFRFGPMWNAQIAFKDFGLFTIEGVVGLGASVAG